MPASVTLSPVVSPFGLHRHRGSWSTLNSGVENCLSQGVLSLAGSHDTPDNHLFDRDAGHFFPLDAMLKVLSTSVSQICPHVPIEHCGSARDSALGKSQPAGSTALPPSRSSLFAPKKSTSSLSARIQADCEGKACPTSDVHAKTATSPSQMSKCDHFLCETDPISVGNVDSAAHSSIKAKNIFYICNSPSPTNVNGFLPLQHDTMLPAEKAAASDTKLNAPAADGIDPGKLHKSLFDNKALSSDLVAALSARLSHSFHNSLTREYTQDVSSSSTDISEDEDYSSEDADLTHQAPLLAESRTFSRAVPAQLQDDDWVSLSSGEESKINGAPDSPLQDGHIFNSDHCRLKASPAHKAESCFDTRTKKRNLLPTIIKTKSLLSTMMSSSLHDESLSRQGLPSRDATPQLRRSCTADTMRFPPYREQSLAGLRQPCFAGRCERLECFDFTGSHQASCLNLCDLNKSGSLSVKQKSSVVLSNFMVVARSSSATISTTELGPQPIRDLVSKSALNLTKLYRSSVSKLSNFADYEGKQSDTDPLKIRHHFAPLNWSIQTQHSDDILTDSSAPPHADPSSVSSPDYDPCSSPYCNDEKWMPNQDSARPETKYGPVCKVVHTKMLTNHKTAAVIVSELSQSLRDSIDKDHKLGKIPLPDRIVHSEAIPDTDMNVNDYHSTGW